MNDYSFPQRAYYAYLSRMYAWMFRLSNRTFLGFRLSTLARWIPIIFLLIGWVRDWNPLVMLLLVLVTVWNNFSLWRANKDNYLRFIADKDVIMATDTLNPLPANTKSAITVSGLFCVSGRESRILHRPASYWYVPLGEHIIMAEETPGKYLYQFFNPTNLQDVRQGWLLHGSKPIRSLAVGFLSQWGPEYTKFGQLYENGKDDLTAPKRVTIYMTSGDERVREAIWQTIISEARRAREIPENQTTSAPPGSN